MVRLTDGIWYALPLQPRPRSGGEPLLNAWREEQDNVVQEERRTEEEAIKTSWW